MSNQISRTIVICSGQDGARIYVTRWGFRPFQSTPMRTKCYEVRSKIVHDTVMKILESNVPSTINLSVFNQLSTLAMHYNCFYDDTTAIRGKDAMLKAYRKGLHKND